MTYSASVLIFFGQEAGSWTSLCRGLTQPVPPSVNGPAPFRGSFRVLAGWTSRVYWPREPPPFSVSRPTKQMVENTGSARLSLSSSPCPNPSTTSLPPLRS